MNHFTMPLTGLKHITQKSFYRYIANCPAEEYIFKCARIDSAKRRQHEKQFSEAHFVGWLVCDIIVV